MTEASNSILIIITSLQSIIIKHVKKTLLNRNNNFRSSLLFHSLNTAPDKVYKKSKRLNADVSNH